ncbi:MULTISPECIES: DUF2905 domain-containing protein [Neobacillus]|uniref:DUF2905 domain-containing protein n=2 Tax=Neobacillus TaxID=2675232 RepID=A0A6B3TTE4_9BACI|nr:MULTISPECIES: DUF2905 domain-containing protein [Neobacillus]AIM15738.1 hypothetical protein HW35_04960 [Bacillus sp. X1(2014)]MCD4838684.1 DUF2905 domain-containing protein [Neobacillus sedimentimangrovi]MED3624456.1 DUF2905 domain-containing protein [Neobacillus thermocopriae]MED3715342.1 DUF2905 domain-containing protein [Neobacillus thermocopriae]NEX80294.1 DUF2905 domain-containing protein [Neobacillus thermocopriae]
MTGLSKTLMIIGAIIFLIGLLMPFINLGKLPGDIVIKKGNTTFYFPIVTSIVLSIVLSLIFYFIGRFR